MLLRDIGGCTCVGDVGGSRRVLLEQVRNVGLEWFFLREKLFCIICGRFSFLRWRLYACQIYVIGIREWEGFLMGFSFWYKLVYFQIVMLSLSQWEAVCDYFVCFMLVLGWICYVEKIYGIFFIFYFSIVRFSQQVMGFLVKDFFVQQQVIVVFLSGMIQCFCLER